MDLVRLLLDAVPVWLVVGVIGTSVLLETGLLVGVALPGTTAVLALGALSGTGYAPLGVTLTVAVVAAVAGTQLAHRSGVRTRRNPASLVGRRVEPRHWERAEALVARWGRAAVPLGQVVVGVRTILPRVVGGGGMTWRRFSLLSVPASAVWAAALVLVGHGAGANVDAAARAVSTGGLVALGALALLAAGVATWSARSRCCSAPV